MRAWIVAVVVALCASRVAVAAPVGADVVVLIDRALPPEKLEVVTRSVAKMSVFLISDGEAPARIATPSRSLPTQGRAGCT